MNTVLLELNSYTQQVRIFKDGEQVSLYSKLSDCTFLQVIKDPVKILEMIADEINDDYRLQVIGNDYEYYLLHNAASKVKDCVFDEHVPFSLCINTKDRIKQLSEFINQKIFVVALRNVVAIPEPLHYGNITVNFVLQSDTYDLELDTLKSLISSACETLLINPLIGEIVKDSGSHKKEILVLSEIEPMLSVHLSDLMEVDEEFILDVETYPIGINSPKIKIVSTNLDVLSIVDNTLVAKAPGETTVKLFASGANKPFYIQNITVKKTILVSKIDVTNFPTLLIEGKHHNLDIKLYPSDATDVDSLEYLSSDQDVADIVNGTLLLKKAGFCEIIIKTKKAEFKNKIEVLPLLKRIEIPKKSIEMFMGDKGVLKVNLVPENAYDNNFSWVSSDESIATILNEEGYDFVKAKRPGECILTCKTDNENIKDSCLLIVKEKKRKSLIMPFVILFFLIFIIGGVINYFSGGWDSFLSGNNGEVDYSQVYEGATAIDVFEEIEINISGSDGSGRASIENTSRVPFVQGCSFEIDEASGLSNGDIVTITVSFKESLIEEYNVYPSEMSKQITIQGLGSKITKASQLTEDMITEVINYTITTENSETENDGYFSYSAATHVETYFQTKVRKYGTALVVIVSKDRYSGGVYDQTNYMPYFYYGLEINENGKLDLESCNISNSTFATSLDSIVDDLYEEDCITEKLD